jgi:hypothetical protein
MISKPGLLIHSRIAFYCSGSGGCLCVETRVSRAALQRFHRGIQKPLKNRVKIQWIFREAEVQFNKRFHFSHLPGSTHRGFRIAAERLTV